MTRMLTVLYLLRRREGRTVRTYNIEDETPCVLRIRKHKKLFDFLVPHLKAP